MTGAVEGGSVQGLPPGADSGPVEVTNMGGNVVVKCDTGCDVVLEGGGR